MRNLPVVVIVPRDVFECMTDSEAGDWRRTWHALRDVLGAKWTFHVVRGLAAQPAGFNELQRRLDGVTAKVLSERLRELRCLGFVSRDVHATIPPTTTYRLTTAGTELAETLESLESMVDVVECVEQDCPVPVDSVACETVDDATVCCDC